jgi:hypothetical protein
LLQADQSPRRDVRSGWLAAILAASLQLLLAYLAPTRGPWCDFLAIPAAIGLTALFRRRLGRSTVRSLFIPCAPFAFRIAAWIYASLIPTGIPGSLTWVAPQDQYRMLTALIVMLSIPANIAWLAAQKVPEQSRRDFVPIVLAVLVIGIFFDPPETVLFWRWLAAPVAAASIAKLAGEFRLVG